MPDDRVRKELFRWWLLLGSSEGFGAVSQAGDASTRKALAEDLARLLGEAKRLARERPDLVPDVEDELLSVDQERAVA